jgi:hypothetical protein
MAFEGISTQPHWGVLGHYSVAEQITWHRAHHLPSPATHNFYLTNSLINLSNCKQEIRHHSKSFLSDRWPSCSARQCLLSFANKLCPTSTGGSLFYVRASPFFSFSANIGRDIFEPKRYLTCCDISSETPRIVRAAWVFFYEYKDSIALHIGARSRKQDLATKSQKIGSAALWPQEVLASKSLYS